VRAQRAAVTNLNHSGLTELGFIVECVVGPTWFGRIVSHANVGGQRSIMNKSGGRPGTSIPITKTDNQTSNRHGYDLHRSAGVAHLALSIQTTVPQLLFVPDMFRRIPRTLSVYKDQARTGVSRLDAIFGVA
jgi:hypothetical protein